MLRTRAAIVEAAASCIERSGVRKLTMSDVSAQARIAKATLYNHFRTKDDLVAALLRSRVEQLIAECSELAAAGLAPALEHAAGRSTRPHRCAGSQPTSRPCMPASAHPAPDRCGSWPAPAPQRC
jgi:AcrR family transcriptional regulator